MTANKGNTVKKTVTKKKTVKKKSIKKAVAKKAPAKKIPAKKTKSANSKIKVTLEQRHKMICEAAYYISLERGYENINPKDDWLQAAAAIKKICTVHTK